MLENLLSIEGAQTILLVLQVLVAIALIGFILIQHGKGADAGAAFGSGASSTVFGSRGSSNFLTKTTAVLAFVFLLNSLLLAYISTQRINQDESIMQNVEVNVTQEEISIPETVEEVPAITESDIPVLPEE